WKVFRSIGKSNNLFHRRRAARSAPLSSPRRAAQAQAAHLWDPLSIGQGEGRLVQTSGIVYCGKAKIDSNVWEGCNGTVATSGTRSDAAEGLLLGEPLGLRMGQRAQSYSARRRPCLLTHWPGEGTLQAQDQTKVVWHSRASAPGGVCDIPGIVKRRT